MNDGLVLHVAADKIENFTHPSEESLKAYLISFAIPDYGILFRCRVTNPLDDPLDLAVLTGLRFIEVSLKTVKVKKALIATDSPAYYFANNAASGASRRARTAETLNGYTKKFQLQYTLTSTQENAARHSTVILPQSPADLPTLLKHSANPNLGSGKMMPLQNGVEL